VRYGCTTGNPSVVVHSTGRFFFAIRRAQSLSHAIARSAAAYSFVTWIAAITALVRRQEAVGLQAVTDGEFRRSWWHYDFLWNLDGVSRVAVAGGIQFAGVQTKAEAPHVTGKIGFSGHPFLAHFRFLKSIARATPKMTIPSPSMLHYRSGRKLINMGVYPDMEDFYVDLGTAYGKAVEAFAAEGCRYLQLDDVSFAYFCDPAQRRILGILSGGEAKVRGDLLGRPKTFDYGGTTIVSGPGQNCAISARARAGSPGGWRTKASAACASATCTISG
jgi:hypothetical protein